MTSDGQPDHRLTSAAGDSGGEDAPGSPPATRRPEVVAPAPDKVRATASVRPASVPPDTGTPEPPAGSAAGAGGLSSPAGENPSWDRPESPPAPPPSPAAFGPYPPPPSAPPPSAPPPSATSPAPGGGGDPGRDGPPAYAMPSAGGPPEYDFSAGGPADYGAATGPGSPGDPSPSPEGPSAGYAPHGYPATAGATPPGSSDAAVGAAPDQDHAIDPSPPQPRQAPGPAGAVSASATVPAANRISAERGEAPPVPSSPRVYGTPIPQEEVDAPLPTRSPRQRPPGQPVYSDLLGPPPDAPRPERGGAAPAAGASLFTPPREKPVQPPAPGGQMFTQRQEAPPRGYDPSLAAPPGPRPPAPDTRAYPATGGAQPPVQGDSGFHRGGHGALAPPPGQPGPPGPGQPGQRGPGWHPPSPPGGGPAPTPPGSAPPDGEQTARSALPIAVIVGAALGAAALVVGVALGIPALLKATQDDPYAVGNCVVRQGDTPVAADCTQPGAYEIVVQVGALEECPEWPDQHAIEDTDTGDVYCLEPVAEPTTEQTPPADVNTPAEQ